MTRRTLLLVFILIAFITGLHAQKSPDEFFNLTIGADRTLVKHPQIINYFKYLAPKSERIQLIKEGESTLGNPMYLAVISSEANIKRLPELIDINKNLANPDKLSQQEVRALLKKGKTFVLITCGIHATEIASTQYSMQLAHQLAVTQDPALNGYLDDVVLLLMPSINPDGNIMVTEWYQRYLGTEYEGARMPFLYHHYSGHDNNRDFYMMNLRETLVVNHVLHHKYFPQVFLDMHQMGSTGARMFVPPFKDPLNANLEPLLVRESNIIGSFMALKLQEQGKKGVASSYAFDAYWPGGSKNTAWFKNVVGILTELASVRTASPVFIEPNELRVSSKGLPEYKAQVNFPDPWLGGWWRLKDIIDYENIAVHALLEIAAKNRQSFLTNFYNLAVAGIEKGTTQPPYAYVIPAHQWDLPATYTFLQKMEAHGVRIFKLEADAGQGDRVFRKGSYVIPLNQPYRSFIKTMMEIQHYPEIKHVVNGPIIEPYDASGWTMPIQMGVKSVELNEPLKGFNMAPVKEISYPEAAVTGEGAGGYYRIPGRYNRSVILINRLFKKGIPVSRYVGETAARPGDFLVKVSALERGSLETVLKGTGVGVDIIEVGGASDVKAFVMPKLGIYQSYRASMDEGWTRWVLDHYEFPYTVLFNKDFTDKVLPRKCDVILFPDLNRDTVIKGMGGRRRYSPGSMPPEYRGGIGDKGMAALKKFVQGGGSVILLDSASELGTADFGLPFRNVLKGVSRDDFYCPGSLLRLQVDPMDPIGWGMERDNFIYFRHSPAFRTYIPRVRAIDRRVTAGFAGGGNHLLSGYLKGGNKLDRAVMVMRFNYHKGKVVVLGGRVQHRSQTFGTFKFLFNSIYYAGLKN